MTNLVAVCVTFRQQWIGIFIFGCIVALNTSFLIIIHFYFTLHSLLGSSAQFLLPFCSFTACNGLEGKTICATLLHTAILALGECCRETSSVWTPGLLTFFSGGSLQPESLILWRSWNLTLTSSMLSWSRSQKPARS